MGILGIIGLQAMGAAQQKASITQEFYGRTATDEYVTAYTLTNINGIRAKIINLGAILVDLDTPDKDGKLADITLGCDSVESYMTESPYFGAIVGRYANRIAKGRFTLDDTEYELATNNDPNHLHGGDVGFDKKLWKAEEQSGDGWVAVKFTYVSPDGEEGYPGEVTCHATYTLTDDDELKFTYEATTDKATVINLTQHSYWNLKGHSEGDILGHELEVFADRYTPTDETYIPTGEIASVEGTPFDFTSPHTMGERIGQVPGGYDLNYVLNSSDGSLALAARVHEPTTGRVMEIYTTEPGIQFYTGNFLDGSFAGKDGVIYEKNGGFCLETQHFPDSPNHADFPTTVLQPGETYTHETVHKFSVRK